MIKERKCKKKEIEREREKPNNPRNPKDKPLNYLCSSKDFLPENPKSLESPFMGLIGIFWRFLEVSKYQGGVPSPQLAIN